MTIKVAVQLFGHLRSYRECAPYLKENTTRNKTVHVTGDLLQVPADLVKLHKDILLTADMLFFNGIPLCITLRRNICFAAVNHISNRKVETIFEVFKDIYIYYMKRGFHIKTLHEDGEFPPIQAMVY